MSGVQFWIEGVALLVVSLFGVVGNLTTIVVLRRIDSNTTFNRLLMSLCECKISSLVFRYYTVKGRLRKGSARARGPMLAKRKSG